MSSNRPDTRPRSTYSRIMRLVVPIVMGAFLVIGLALFFAIRAGAYGAQAERHRLDVAEFTSDVTGEIQSYRDTLRGLATARDTRDFARDTLLSMSGSSIDATQNRLLGNFTSLLQQHPDYLALRYVTFNGSVWSEVTNYDGRTPVASSRISLGALANDPSLAQALTLAPGEVVMTGINFPSDAETQLQTPFIRLSAPVAPDSSFDASVAGVVQLDVQPAMLLEYIASAADSDAARLTGRRILLADHDGNILYDTASPNFDTLGALAQGQSPLLANQFPNLATQLQQGQIDAAAENGGLLSSSRVAFDEGENIFWTVVLVDDAAALAGNTNSLAFGALLGSLALGGLICFLISEVLRRTLLPVGSISTLVHQFTGDVSLPLAAAVPTHSTAASRSDAVNSDISSFEQDAEIGQLVEAFRAVGTHIDALKAEMEGQQRRYNRSLDITARVGRETATLNDIDEVLNRAINLICDEFGFYHAQVFLVDDVGENAVLVYSHGEVGQKLLDARHKLAIGSESVIGQATATGKAVVVNDTTQTSGAPHRFNPLLPETRAEVALPLQVGDHILGALDVQSIEPDSFQSDEVRTFQILADQIAIAMQNVRLLAQTEQRLMQIDALNRQLTRIAWEETSQRSGLAPIYRYDLLNLTHDEPETPPTFSLPIAIRGEVIGSLDAAPPEGTFFTEGDYAIMRAVADRVAISVENARLFEEAQTQAQRALALAEAGQLASRMSREFVHSLEEVFQRIALPANYDRWALVLLNDEGTALERVTSQLSPEFDTVLDRAAMLDLASDYSPLVQTYKRQRILVINDPHSVPGPGGEASANPDVFGKTVMIPVRLGEEVVGVLMLGRPLTQPDLAESDEQLASTLAAQVSIALENQRLLRAAESERERLSSILATLPAGVLVLDPETYKPVQFNNQIEQLLGRPLSLDLPFDVATYRIYRSGTDALYPMESLPIFAVSDARELLSSDDIAVIHEDGSEVDLLMNAVPILDDDGTVVAIVAAFQDISALRNLERTLETNLRDTVALYETTRVLAEAEEVDNVLDEVFNQLVMQEVSSAYVLLADARSGVQIVRSLDGTTGDWTLPLTVLDLKNPVYIPDVSAAEALTETEQSMLQASFISALATLPLRARSRRDAPLGWLVVGYDEPHELAQESEQFLNALGDSAAVALDNRYLLRSTEQALQDTAALYGATTNLSRARTEGEIGAAIRGAFASLSPDLYAGYLLVDDQLNELFNTPRDADDAIDFTGMIARYNLLQSENRVVADLNDVENPTPFERALLELGGVRAYALMVLRSQNIPVGCFILAYHAPHNFNSGDERYLSSVADSASVVVNNYLLLDQVQSSLLETSVLYQASRALNDASSPAEILSVIVNHLSSRPVTQVFLALLSAESWDAPNARADVVAAWEGAGDTAVDLSGMSFVSGQYPAWRLLASPTVLTIDDINESGELDELERIGVESLEIRSLSVLPLRIAGRALGAFVIGGGEPYHHAERDLRIYRSLAEQASLRLEAVRLFAQTQRRARQLTTSAEVSQIASSILDLNDLLPRIVDLIRDSFGYDQVQIFLMDDQGDFANLRASTGSAGRQLLEIRHRLQKGSQSVIGQVTATGTPTIVSDTASTGVAHRPNPYLPNTRSEMAVPLKLQGRVVGALDVQSNEANAFDSDDVQVLTTLAAQISVAIDNAQLFERSRSRANEMSFLFDVTTAAASAETLQLAIQNVANELRNSLEALSVSIYLPQTYLNTEDEEIIILHPVALAGSQQPLSELSEVRLESLNNLIADSARARRPTIVSSIEERPDYLPVIAGAQSAIIVPLTAGAQLIGLIALESGEPAAYGNDTLTLLLTLSGTLSAIIQNQQLLEQVQETNEQLRELDRLKSDFLANMSHELRTPLNSIIGFSRVILKGIDGALTEMQEQDLTTIYNSGLHLLNLINDILDQAKIAAGKMDLQFDYFEMKNVIDGVRSIGIGLVKDKPIDIFVDVAPGLPKAYGDEFRTRQVLINLVSNAAKFTREGSITLSTYPVVEEETGQMMIRTDVTDTGIGIAENDMMLLFEAFRQVDSSLTRTQGGTGLGLPISKSLVEMQNGRMAVSSRVNSGSTFSVLMPIEPPTKEEEKLKKTAPLTIEGRTRTGTTGTLTAQNNPPSPPPDIFDHPENGAPPFMHIKRQILLIEDNPDMVDQYRRALQREGFDIFTASIPLEAEAMASGLHPTIIIMDVNFAGGQGWNILGKLKARDDTFDIPVIIVTLSSDRERAEEMGTFRFIPRPFAPEDLVQAVQDAERESRIDKILIIDDQPESVRLLTQALDEQGKYRVFSASNGADGIALVARRRPNLVILDLRMPEMDGFKVVQELRGNPETATIPILVVTGDAVSGEERQQLTNLSVLDKGEITAEEYQQFINGVRANLNGE